MKYALGLDIGIASVGWSVINKEKNRIEKLGVRLFQAAEVPKTKGSLAEFRRISRSQRRRLRRKSHRLERIRRLIVNSGMMDKESLSNLYPGSFMQTPYELRSKGLDHKLSNTEWVRVLIHIAKRRGFKSNRKSEDSNKKSDSGLLLAGVKMNKDLMEAGDYRSVGEMMQKDAETYDKHKRNKGGDYSHTVARSMLEDEVHLLFLKQREFGNAFATEDIESKYTKIFLDQRPFASKEDIANKTGKCTLEPEELRAPKNSFTAEHFRLVQDCLNLLQVFEDGKKRPLHKEEMDKVIALAYSTKNLKYLAIRKKLGWDSTIQFARLPMLPKKKREQGTDPESQKFISLVGYHDLRKALEKSFPDFWKEINQEARDFSIISMPVMDQIAYALTFYKTDEDIKEYLLAADLSSEIIEALLSISFAKVSHLSIKAMRKLLIYMEEGMRYDEAIVKVGYEFNPYEGKAKHKLLPVIPAEEIRNPVVLRSLTQTRKVVNAIIRKYGSPETVHIEMAREFGRSAQDRNKMEKEMNERRTENERLEGEMKEEFTGIFVNRIKRKDRIKYLLWKEQDGICAYSQQSIPIETLFDIGYAEVDHILPWSRSYNDSMNNKVLVKTRENQQKANQTPFEYFGSDKKRWHRYEEWVDATYKGNRRKKNHLLMQNADESIEKEWKSRNLNDTRYIARFMKNYITAHLEFAESDRKQRVYVLSGPLTARLRARWGLMKNRDESDLHHAVDATIAAVCNQKLVQTLELYEKSKEIQYHDKFKTYVNHKSGEVLSKHFPRPWESFRDEVNARLSENPKEAIDELALESYSDFPMVELKRILISRAPKRKVTGAGHAETILTSRLLESNKTVKKCKLQDLTFKKLETMHNIKQDRKLYEALKARLEEFDGNAKKAFEKDFYKPTGPNAKERPLVRSVKLVETAGAHVKIRDGIAANASMVRLDVFEKGGKNYLVPIYTADVNRGILPQKSITANTKECDWEEIGSEHIFKYVLQYNDLIEFEIKGKYYVGYYLGCDRATGAISIYSPYIKESKPQRIGLKTAKKLQKYHVTILGEIYPIKREKRRELEKSLHKP